MTEIKLPDFDDMFKLTEEIGKLSLDKMMIETDIEDRVAFVVREVTTNGVYFMAGKPPSMEYLKSTFIQRGLTGEVIEMKRKLSEVTARLDELKLKFQVLRDMISVFQTQSANKRAATM